MLAWSRYKNYIFNTIHYSAKSSIRVVVDSSTNKSYFCINDLLSNFGYVLIEHEKLNNETLRQCAKVAKISTFIELYPYLSFISVSHLRLLAPVISRSRSISKTTVGLELSRCLNAFLNSFKTREEVEISSELENIVEIAKHNFSVATYKNKTVIKATDILRFCGYSCTKVKDNFLEYSVKIKTPHGVTNFIALDDFMPLADSMLNVKYSRRLKQLYNSFKKEYRTNVLDIVVKKDKALVVLDTSVIAYIVHDNEVAYNAVAIQKACGYKGEGINQNFKSVSVKIQKTYYITLEKMRELLKTRMLKANKEGLTEVVASIAQVRV